MTPAARTVPNGVICEALGHARSSAFPNDEAGGLSWTTKIARAEGSVGSHDFLEARRVGPKEILLGSGVHQIGYQEPT
jgi:hypothetical protein